MRRTCSRFLTVLPFALLFVTLLWPLLLLRKSFTLADYSLQHLPWAAHTYDAARRGGLPLWTDMMGGGFPLFAEGQCAALYSMNWLGYRLLPFLTAYTWSIPLHLLIGGFGIYKYARSLKLSREAGMLAAIVFCFSSAYAGCFYNTASLRALCWVPLVLWLLERLRAGQGNAFSFAALCFVISQQWVAGFPQMTVYAFGYFALYELLVFFEKRAFRAPLLLGAALLCGTLIAWPQIAPTLELIGQSVRQRESAAFALWGSVLPPAIAGLVYPHWAGALQVSFYAGIAPLFLAGLLFCVRREKPVLRHGILLLIFFALALGKYNPLYRWVVETFSITAVRNPSKFLFFSVTSLAVLAACGYDQLLEAVRTNRNTKKMERFILALAAGVWLLPSLAQGLLSTLRAAWPGIKESYVSNLLAEKGGAAKDPAHYFERLDGFFRSLPELFSYGNRLNLEAIVLATASAVLILFFIRKKLSEPKFYLLLSAVLIWDLGFFGFTLGPGFIGNAGLTGDLAPSAQMQRVIEDTRAHPGPLAELTGEGGRELFPPNSGMMYGVRHAGAYSPLLLKNYHELIRDLGITDASLGRNETSEEIWRTQRHVLDLIGVRYVYSDHALSWANWERVGAAPGYFLYENRTALEDLTAYTFWSIIEDPQERLDYIRRPMFDPASEAVLSDSVLTEGMSPAKRKGSAVFNKISTDRPDEMNFHVSMSNDGLVMARVAAYPGWKVEVDGKHVPWGTANHAFLGFMLKAGDHAVRLVYLPTSWPLAWGATFLGVLLTVLTAFFFRRGK